jgi:hypothetical protein
MLKKISGAAVAGLILFMACKKSTSEADATLQKMQGTWYLDANIVTALNPSTGAWDTVLKSVAAPPALGQVIFDNNGTVDYQFIPGRDTVMPYHAVNSQMFVQGKDTGHIQTLTANSFMFYLKNATLKQSITLSK